MEEESVTAIYFHLIHNDLIAMEEASWVDRDRLDLLKLDVAILEMFCMRLETWKYSINNEESMERLRSLIDALNVIWPKDFTLLSLLLEERMGETGRPSPIDVCIQDFESVMFELEGIILQSKQQVEGWCGYWMMMQCSKSSDIWRMSDFVNKIQTCNEYVAQLHRRGAGKSVLLEKQFDILRPKIRFLQTTLKNFNICRPPHGKEILQVVNFIGDFANRVAWLTCLFWAKEDADEIASDLSDLDSVLFDMLQDLVPYAFDITPLCVGILKGAYNLQFASDPFVLGEVVESLVDFFFRHLATVLKDDYFLFLRDRLLLLFTFLTDLPCESENENAEEEEEGGDIIRSQIYAILHEDVYLLLSFEEMNEDFSDKKELLNGCMTRIDVAIAKIRQLKHRSSGSQITFEVEKMQYDYFASIQRELYFLDRFVQGVLKRQMHIYIRELRFLRVFSHWLAALDDTDEEIKVRLSSMITSFKEIWGVKEEERLLAHRLHKIRSQIITATVWHPLALELQGKIQQSKLEIKAWCVNLFHLSFQFKTSTSYMILKRLDSILDNLNGLVIYKASKIIPFKKQIETLAEKLILLKNLLKLAVNCNYFQESGEFEIFVQAFANDAVWLAFLYWTEDANAQSASETSSMLSHLLQKIKPSTPNVVRLYFGTLMAIYAHRSDSHMFGQTAYSFVDLFLEDLVTHLKDDDFQILQGNIVFLLTFLNDPPNQNAEDSICSQIDVLFWEGLYGLIPFDDIEGGFSKKKVLLSDFMMKIEAFNANIKCIYGKFPDSSLYNFPTVISPQFLDFLMQNLRNLKDRMNTDRKYAPFAKYNILKIEEEMASLCPFFIHIFDLQSELNETWLEVVNVLHLSEHVIASCISSWFVFDQPFWYHMAYLSNVFDEIKVVKAKLEMMKLDNIINHARCLPGSVGFISELAKQSRPSEINEIVMGFEDEKEKIIGMLTCGPDSLDIVSIVGMGGLGKTTLAKKIFGSSSVKCQFHVFAFCSVSVDHDTRRMLHDIIRDVNGVDGISSDMTTDDLAHKLQKCLRGQKYLVVLDDIWNVNAWNAVKRSFPDSQNGSRVMITTRSREVADKCRINCSPHQLRFLNEAESWEILQKKVFRNDISPPYLNEIGKQIAKNCKGLALAVVVIGGLLAKTEESLSGWSEVAQRLVYYLSSEGCMEILELSYKHLPENLKPCLLYLGAFPEDAIIRVKHVIQLWIAEGFVQESKTKSLEDVATEYFHVLVDRSFIIVGVRSTTGGIRAFSVHDLIRELCQTKCRAGNFFQMNHKIASSSSLEPSINNHYRLSMENMCDHVTDAAGSSFSNARTVHFFGEDRGNRVSGILLRKFRLVQVLGLDPRWEINDINQLTTLIHLRYMDTELKLKQNSIPSSISNLWNITSLTLRLDNDGTIHLPENFWRMKSLRYVKVDNCIIKFPDEEEAFLSSDEIILDKVVSFSKPVLSTGKDVKRLLQRLPVVRKLGCVLRKSHVYDEESIETLDFYYRELESLVLFQPLEPRQYMINFPSTLKKLTLSRFLLHRADLSAIAELHYLQVLKLQHVSFVEPTLEMEDLVFENLIFIEMSNNSLVEWNASTESFPCLEQLWIQLSNLKELPPCFGEISAFKRIDLVHCSPSTENSALRIQEELMELGIQLEVMIMNRTSSSS